MVNLELWQFILGAISTLTVGGVIASIVSIWWLRRRNEAETQKQEEEAKQEHHHTAQAGHEADTVAIQNTKELIQAYRDGFNDLKKLYEESTKELEERCKKLEEDLGTLQQTTHEKIQKLEKEVTGYKKRLAELEDQLTSKCSSCEFAEDCKKRISLGLPMSTKRTKPSKSSSK